MIVSFVRRSERKSGSDTVAVAVATTKYQRLSTCGDAEGQHNGDVHAGVINRESSSVRI